MIRVLMLCAATAVTAVSCTPIAVDTQKMAVETPGVAMVDRMVEANANLLKMVFLAGPYRDGDTIRYDLIYDKAMWEHLSKIFDTNSVDLIQVGTMLAVRGKVDGYLLQRTMYGETATLVGTREKPLDGLRQLARTLLASGDEAVQRRGVFLAQLLLDRDLFPNLKPLLDKDGTSLQGVSALVVQTWLRRCETPEQLSDLLEGDAKGGRHLAGYSWAIRQRRLELDEMVRILTKAEQEAKLVESGTGHSRDVP